MKLISRVKAGSVPKHVAIILDGNGRWAKRRGLNRKDGHKEGAKNLRRIALLAESVGIEVLSVYAFSTENWSRPKAEVDYLMEMPALFENEFQPAFEDHNIRVVFSGRRDRLEKKNVDLLKRVENESKDRSGMILNVCLDYGSYDEIVQATKAISLKVARGELKDEAIDETVFRSHLYTKDLPDVDFLIRTSGEIRLSNFLLWQVAYAEFYFTKTPWPAFKERRFLKAIRAFQKRNRQFGGLKG